MHDRFVQFSRKVSDAAGSPYAFVAACAIIALWAVSGFVFGATDTWQLVINTGTTIITFLMIFLVQGSQNRDTAALNLKLDEVIRATDNANNKLIDVEHDTDEQLAAAREVARNAKIAECS